MTDTPHSVWLLWTSDQPFAETSTWQHTTLKTDIHAPGGFRTHNLVKRAAADPRLRPRGHWDRQDGISVHIIPDCYFAACCVCIFRRVPAIMKVKKYAWESGCMTISEGWVFLSENSAHYNDLFSTFSGHVIIQCSKRLNLNTGSEKIQTIEILLPNDAVSWRSPHFCTRQKRTHGLISGATRKCTGSTINMYINQQDAQNSCD